MKITLFTPTKELSFTVDEGRQSEIKMAITSSIKSGYPAVFQNDEQIYMLPAELLKSALISIEEESTEFDPICEELEKDAKRYRWLLANDPNKVFSVNTNEKINRIHPHEIDDAIDDELTKEAP